MMCNAFLLNTLGMGNALHHKNRVWFSIRIRFKNIYSCNMLGCMHANGFSRFNNQRNRIVTENYTKR